MIEEIPLNSIREFAPYFSCPQLGMILDSIAEGNTRAALWRSLQPQNDITLLLWDKGNNVFYFPDNLIAKEAINKMTSLIQIHIEGIAIQEGLSRFNVRTLSPSLAEALPDLFQGVQRYNTNKLFYGFQQFHVLSNPAGLENLQYKLIDTDFLQQFNFNSSTMANQNPDPEILFLRLILCHA